MTYVPDPTDATRPVDTDPASSATAEFRALKAYIQTVLGTVASIYNPVQNYILGGDSDTNPWQRGTTFAAVTDGEFTADRFLAAFQNVAGAALTVQRSNDAPSIASSGIYGITCMDADVTANISPLAVNSFVALITPIEGPTFRALYEKASTLTFWHKHDVAGNYYVFLTNAGHDEWFVGQYTQVNAGTWENAIIHIPAHPSSGTWNFTAGNTGLSVGFVLAAGSNFYGTAGVWASGGPFYCVSDQVNILATTSNNFRICQINLITGTLASPSFISEDPVTVLFKCQRYYETNKGGDSILFNGNVTSASTYIAKLQFETQKAVMPTVTLAPNGATNFNNTIGAVAAFNVAFTESRAATGTGVGTFRSTWSASAELTW